VSYLRKLNHISSAAGFTLLEALVAAGLTTLTTGLMYVSVLTVRDGYIHDVHRTRINGNLRSAMDILSMHIRQSGEYLPALFPAVEVIDGEPESDTLILRRGLLSEVLTLCEDASMGSSTLTLSSGDLADSACYVGNVEPMYNTVLDRVNDADSELLRLFVFDRSTLEYEFVELEQGSLIGDEYRFSISPLSNTYSRMNTSIYLVEEMRFVNSSDDKTLSVSATHFSDESRPLAFHVDAFRVSLMMQDGETRSELSGNSGIPWKNIKRIMITLSGGDAFKDREFSSSISGEFFPRNVLSYE